jgi:hypothetical protein
MEGILIGAALLSLVTLSTILAEALKSMEERDWDD